jgi:hypothetical protein
MRQCIFGWFEGMMQQSRVLTLNRWTGCRWVKHGYLDAQLVRVGYQAWLRWYPPLCERGQS